MHGRKGEHRECYRREQENTKPILQKMKYNTIREIDPRKQELTVHFDDASFADRTVVGSFWFEGIASSA